MTGGVPTGRRRIMTFDPVEFCGPDPWIDIARIVLLWIVPVVLFVIRRQLPAGRNAGLLSVVVRLSALLATLLSLPWLDLIDRSDPIFPLAAVQAARIAALAFGGVYLYRFVRQRRQSVGECALR
jgi:hypothetical protein